MNWSHVQKVRQPRKYTDGKRMDCTIEKQGSVQISNLSVLCWIGVGFEGEIYKGCGDGNQRNA